MIFGYFMYQIIPSASISFHHIQSVLTLICMVKLHHRSTKDPLVTPNHMPAAALARLYLLCQFSFHENLLSALIILLSNTFGLETAIYVTDCGTANNDTNNCSSVFTSKMHACTVDIIIHCL